MKTIILLLLPICLYSQKRSFNIDHHRIARNSAYTSMCLMGFGTITGVGIASVDQDLLPQAVGMSGAIFTIALIYQVRAWYHVGEAGNRTSFYIKPQGVALTYSF